MPEITKMLTLSTAHVSMETAFLLEKEAQWGTMANITVYPKGGLGNFIYIHPEIPIPTNMPADLKDILQYAAKHDCKMICLDRDGPIELDLSQYDW